MGENAAPGWTHIAVGVGAGVLVALVGANIYVGASLRQIDVNTATISTIQAGGSQPVIGLHNQMESANQRLSSLERELHQVPSELSSLREVDARHMAELAEMSRQINVLQHQQEKAIEERDSLLQRVATLEALIAGRKP